MKPQKKIREKIIEILKKQFGTCGYEDYELVEDFCEVATDQILELLQSEKEKSRKEAIGECIEILENVPIIPEVIGNVGTTLHWAIEKLEAKLKQ